MKSIVLVAVSDPFRMELIQEACETVGHQVVLASDTETALTVMARDPASLLIIDEECAMLTPILRADRELCDVPIIGIGEPTKGLSACLGEPLRVDEVQRVVRRLLRNAQESRRRRRSSRAMRAVTGAGAGSLSQLRVSLPYEVTQAQRYRRPLGCVVIHGEQDLVSSGLPRCLGLIRESDQAFRTAPGEVVVLLPEADETGVALVVGRIAGVCDSFRFGVLVVNGDDAPMDLLEATRARVC
ncbi:MAG: hypothetical protein ACI9KE_002625 [Polyangiales bacterium]